MNKFLLYCICFIFCSCSKEIVIDQSRQPDIRKYIDWDIKNLTYFDDEYCYPKFIIKVISKVSDFVILEYEVDYAYVFGQDWDVLLHVKKRYIETDEEIKLLNEQGYFIIEHELKKNPIETEYDLSAYTGKEYKWVYADGEIAEAEHQPYKNGMLNYNEVQGLDKYIRLRKK